MKQLAPVYIVALIAVTWLISFSLSKLLMPKRMTNVYKGEDQSDKIFEIAPTSGYFLFNKEFHLKDSQNQTVLIYKRYFFHSIFRIKWNAYTPNGEYIFSCMEDSIPMAILRRYLNLGKLIPLHFILTKDGKTKFGDFKRKFSIKDKYKLDYEYHTAPGWIIIAAAILLDTGEKR